MTNFNVDDADDNNDDDDDNERDDDPIDLKIISLSLLFTNPSWRGVFSSRNWVLYNRDLFLKT